MVLRWCIELGHLSFLRLYLEFLFLCGLGLGVGGVLSRGANCMDVLSEEFSDGVTLGLSDSSGKTTNSLLFGSECCASLMHSSNKSKM